MKRQKTFGDMGLDATVPASKLADDIVAHIDGAPIRRADAIRDCRGNVHPDEEERHEADVEIVTEELMAQDKWVEEYTNGEYNDDYADGYTHIIDECSHDWAARIDEWICDEHGDSYGNMPYHSGIRWNKPRHDVCLQDIISAIRDDLSSDDTEPEYDRSEYSAYSDSGCCLLSVDVGEYEHQIDVNDVPELKVLHEERRLDDVLDDINCDAYVRRSKERRRNEETGYYEEVGRETYGVDDKYPCVMTYHNPGGQWHFVIPHERMVEAMATAIVTLARRMDSKS